MRVVIDDFRSFEKNSLRGFCRARLPEGLILHEVTIHVMNGSVWASPPARPQLDRTGAQMKDSAGKPLWQPILTFSTKADRDSFSRAIILALRENYPDALR